MKVSDEGQMRVFLLYIALGVICVAVYDMFRVIAKRYAKNALMENAVDICCFSAVFVLILAAGIKYNFGAFRYYQMLGLALGITAGVVLLSRIVRKAFDILLSAGEKTAAILTKIIKAPCMLILRGFFTVLLLFEDKVMKIFVKLKKVLAKLNKKREKRKKNLKKRIKML